MHEESKESPAIVDRKSLRDLNRYKYKKKKSILGRTKDEEKEEPGISICTISAAEKDREYRSNRFQGRRWR